MRGTMIARFVILSVLLHICRGASPDEWKSRTIYQIVTDRFAQNTDNYQDCDNLSDYCGGTFQGIINHLDYIQDMGFDALWISPIIKNTPGGYHGYWAENLYEVNPHFGTSDDLSQLVDECHSRGMLVMVDVVANHVGPVGYDYSTIVPFNQPQHYHNCSTCPSGCSIQDFNNQPQVEICRLAGLPDLAQEDPFVAKALLSWIANMTSFYKFDGIRIDTVPEVPKWFWSEFQSSAAMYGVGEVYNGNVDYVAGYQQVLDGLLSYPLFFTLRNVFTQSGSMYNIQSTLQAYSSAFKDLDLLGTFIDNQDHARFLFHEGDLQLYRNAITYVLLGQGIPIIYYGTEQGFSGGYDPDNREVLWPTKYNEAALLYKFIQSVNKYRHMAQPWNSTQIQRYADDQFYAFTRGNTFVALTNVGSSGPQIQRTITYHPYADGTKLCNWFWPTQDCLLVQNGQFEVYLDSGECKIYHPV